MYSSVYHFYLIKEHSPSCLYSGWLFIRYKQSNTRLINTLTAHKKQHYFLQRHCMVFQHLCEFV